MWRWLAAAAVGVEQEFRSPRALPVVVAAPLASAGDTILASPAHLMLVCWPRSRFRRPSSAVNRPQEGLEGILIFTKRTVLRYLGSQIAMVFVFSRSRIDWLSYQHI